MTNDTFADATKDAVLDAALAHVPFDGWSEITLRAAIADSGVAEALARALFPRGPVDLALAYHHRGDMQMMERLAAADLGAMRYRDRVIFAIRQRLELVGDKELVRRGSTLFSLPHHAADGARAVWGTADAIWRALGDTSTDLNWYTKRATLSGVYAATVLFWLGDDSSSHQSTWGFLERRIDDVMRIEKLKAQVRENPLSKAFQSASGQLFGWIRPPVVPDDLPGKMGMGGPTSPGRPNPYR
jgi:ubiquinone biosynthesis protein COQ9